ncbi:MAG: phosphoadenosine phosphosulfate reductase family protein [Sedimentisphaerales bacterium]|nr:phosphoadenosine phosphosulfate reductase family protein [Sedimentisphaerales bacterium]
MSKIYLLQNVYEAAIERLEFVRDNFDRVIVAFSGGKDSTLTLALAFEVLDGLTVYFWDKESNLLTTRDFILDTFDALPAGATPYWFCLPYKMRNALSVYEPYWTCWNPDARERWIYPIPDRRYVYTRKNNILEEHGYTPERHNLYRLFAELVSERGRYRTAILVGLRADESLNRFRAVTKNPQFGHGWIAQTDAPNCYNVYPIYDWSFGDVWVYINCNRIPYNPVYDLMWQRGLLKRNIRISQSFCDVSKQGIPILRELEPESFERFLQRVDGVNSMTHVDLGEVLKAAAGVDYDFLLQLYPENVREQIQSRVERSQVLEPDDPNVIRALLNNDIRLKRVNRAPRADLKERWKDL